MNDLDLRLEVVSKSCQTIALQFDVEYLENQMLEIEAWFLRKGHQ